MIAKLCIIGAITSTIASKSFVLVRLETASEVYQSDNSEPFWPPGEDPFDWPPTDDYEPIEENSDYDFISHQDFEIYHAPTALAIGDWLAGIQILNIEARWVTVSRYKTTTKIRYGDCTD